jgi:hypothetical protein
MRARRLVVLSATAAIGVPTVAAAAHAATGPAPSARMTAPARTPAAAPMRVSPPPTAATPESTQAVSGGRAPAPTPVAADNDVSSPPLDRRAADDALAYWTPARMAAAKPLALPSGSEGRQSTSPPGKPVAVPRTADPQTGTSVGGAAAGVPRPYTTAPARTEVKIFFIEDGEEYVCSGTVVNSRSKRMVDTAGHCVSDGAGNYHSDFVVVPAYSSRCSGCADEPYGAWTARTVTTRAEWHLHANLKQDLAYIVTDDRNGRRIADVVGGVGTKFDISRNQQWAATGYPADSPFNGDDLFVSLSGRVADDDPDAGTGSSTIGIACNMTHGSSGGGWMTGPYTNGIGYLNGHNSYRPTEGPLSNPDLMFGPYYGDEALALFNYTAELG